MNVMRGALNVLAAAVLVAAAALSAPAAGAAENELFGVAPHPDRLAGESRRTIDVALGDRGPVTDSVRVWNRSGRTLTLKIYAADASVGDDGVVAVGGEVAPRNSAASRVRVSRKTVTLDTGTDVVVDVEIPAGVLNRTGQLAAVAVEEAPPEGEGAGIDLVQRVALLIRPSATAVDVPAEPSRPPYAIAVAAAAVLALGWLVHRRRRSVLAARKSRRGPEDVPGTPVVSEPAPPPFVIESAVGPERPPVKPAPRAAERKTPRRAPAKKLNYIPLDS